uniref:Uncharacterized protein n=1 Tax=Schizaphis graminum TaxID=13262 RepID=A0A2S2P2F3_SCHGA
MVDGNSESMNTSLFTPEYITAKGLEIIKSIVLGKLIPKVELVDIYKTTIRLPTPDREITMPTPRCGMQCPNIDEPCSIICSHCLLHYHPECVNMHADLKNADYICLHCQIKTKQNETRVQSSHTVTVVATEPEKLHVEPILIRQVHPSSSTQISKIEEPHYKIDEYTDENVII